MALYPICSPIFNANDLCLFVEDSPEEITRKMAKFRQFAVDLASRHNITTEELLAGFIEALGRGDLSDILQQDVPSEIRDDDRSTQNDDSSNESSANTAELSVVSRAATVPDPGPMRQRKPIYRKESFIDDQATTLPSSSNRTYRAQVPSSLSEASDAKPAPHRSPLPSNMHDPKTSEEDGALRVSVEACSVDPYTHYLELSKPRTSEKRDGEELCNISCAPSGSVEACSVDSYTHYLELSKPRASEEIDGEQFCNKCAIL